MWIEINMSKGSNLNAGWIWILHNSKQLMADTKNINNISQIQASLHMQVNRKQYTQKYKEYAPACMSRDDQSIQDLIFYFKDLIAFHLIQYHPLYKHCSQPFQPHWNWSKTSSRMGKPSWKYICIHSKKKSMQSWSCKTEFTFFICWDSVPGSCRGVTENETNWKAGHYHLL